MNVDADAVRELMQKVKISAETLRSVQQKFKNVGNDLNEWHDEKGAEVRSVVDNVCNIMQSPIDKLESSVPKMQQVIQIIEDYNSHHPSGR